MITRPLDLSARLRPAPRSFLALAIANVGLVAFFFVLFGSRFVLAPGVGADFQLPEVPGATAGAVATTHHLNVVGSGQVFAGDGLRDVSQLRPWLERQAGTAASPSLLVQASREVPLAVVMEIAGLAHAAGFKVHFAATEPVAPARSSNRAK